MLKHTRRKALQWRSCPQFMEVDTWIWKRATAVCGHTNLLQASFSVFKCTCLRNSCKFHSTANKVQLKNGFLSLAVVQLLGAAKIYCN